MLDFNARYLKKRGLPASGTDVVGAHGVVYRAGWGYGLQFHPLANVGALNVHAAAGGRSRRRRSPRRSSTAWFPASRARCGSTTSRSAAARRRGRPAWRRPSAPRRSRAPGEDDSGAAGVRRRSPGRSSSVSARARGSGSTTSATRRPERAAPDDPLAPRVRGDVGEQRAKSVRHEPRQDGPSEAVRVRHRLLVALLARGRSRRSRTTSTSSMLLGEARAAHRPEGLAGQARPLRRLHDQAPLLKKGERQAAVLSLAERRRSAIA